MQTITLLYSGNFGLGHEIDTILRAVRSFNITRYLKILLVGSGKGLPLIRQLVSDLWLENVEFCPSVPLHELFGLLTRGDVHVVAQKPRTEGLIVPSKIYGALAVGRPVLFVGPGECEVARIVRDSGCGFVIAPGDTAYAAYALRRLVSDESLRRAMGELARLYYQQKLGRKRSVSKIVEVIEGIGVDHHERSPGNADRTAAASHPPALRSGHGWSGRLVPGNLVHR